MKKYFNHLMVISCLLLNTFILFANDTKFNVERMNTDFKGLCHNENIVIAYGSNGIIMTSLDKGLTWNQKKIVSDSLTIHKMYNINGNFYGVCGYTNFNSDEYHKYNNFSYLTKSVDNGSSWTTVQAVTNQNILWGITANNENIYVLTSTTDLTEYLISVYNHEFKGIGFIGIDSPYIPTELTLIDHYLVMPDSNKLITLNINDYYSSKVYNLDKDMNLSSLKVIENNLYAIANDSILYKNSNSNFSKWAIITYPVGNYECYNSNIYDLRISISSDYSFGDQSSPGKWNLCWPNFFKLNQNTFNQVNQDSIQRLVLSYNWLPLPNYEYEFLDEQTIIAVGSQKIIYRSTNAGINWELKCNFNNYVDERVNSLSQFYWLNNKLGYFCNFIQISKTTNGGITWLPQIFTDDSASSVSMSIKNIQWLNYAYFDSTGFGFVFGISNFSNVTNCLMTKDYGETYKCVLLEGLNDVYLTFHEHPINILKSDSGILIDIPCTYYASADFRSYTKLKTYDTNLNFHNTYYLDSMQTLFLKKEEGNKLTALSFDSKYPYNKRDNPKKPYIFTNDSTRIHLMHSDDFGETWKDDSVYILKGNSPLYTTIKGDDLFFYMNSNNLIYYLNTANKSVNVIRDSSDTQTNDYPLFIYQNTLFTSDNKNKNLYSCSNYQNSNPIWNQSNIISNDNYLYFLRSTYDLSWTNDSLIYGLNGIQFYRNTSEQIFIDYSNIFKLTPILATSVEENLISINNDFEINSPYPIPAKDIVSAYAFWNGNCDINKADFSVFDIYGNNLTDKTKLIFTQENSNKGLLSWDCSTAGSGVYFLSFSINGIKRVRPVMVVK